MPRNKLMSLLMANARKGSFRAEANTIYIYDSIVSSAADAEWFGGVDAETFVQTLKNMSGDVTLRINSPGGDVFAARAMAQAIREYPGQVTAQVDGLAASAASFLTSVADSTVMGEGAMLMIHKAWSVVWGNADDMTQTADLLGKIDVTIAETYAAAAAKRGIADGTDFGALMAAETWLTGAEAIALGLADAVVAPPAKTAPAAASARWDLSAYDRAPAALAQPVQADVTPDMTARQQQLYDAVEGVAESLGQFDQGSGANGAHYMTENPFAALGIKCANCAFFDGARSCEVVAGDIDPAAACKLWIIPETLISEGAAPAPASAALADPVSATAEPAALANAPRPTIIRPRIIPA